MVIREEKGSTLVMILIIFLVLSILGLALWHYSIFDIRQGINTKHKKVAYYYARGGAEIAFAYLQSLTDYGGAEALQNTEETLYLYGDFEISHEGGQDNLNFRYQELADTESDDDIRVEIVRIEEELIEIQSKGYVQNQQSLVILRLLTPQDYENIAPINSNTEPLSGVEGEDYYHSSNDDLEPAWTDGKNIISEGEMQESTKAISFSGLDNKGEEIELSYIPGGGVSGYREAYFSAPEIHFNTSLKLNPNVQLNLYSPLIVFHDEVTISSNSTLCLHVPEGEVGYVVFKEGVNNNQIAPGTYLFTGSVCLPDGAVDGLRSHSQWGYYWQ